MFVRIYKTPKSAMQSGRGNNDDWVVEPATKQASTPGALMGWVGGGSTLNQIKLNFDSKAQAVDYAVKNGLSYEVIEENKRIVKPKAYADNFAYSRAKPWTH
ncbi:MAG: ETC complex I subunit [Alphaproteobacteria bacterium]